MPYEHIRWIENEELDLDKLIGTSDMKKIKDLKEQATVIVRPQLEYSHDRRTK